MTVSRHFGDDEAVIRHGAVANGATASFMLRRRHAGFTLIELLTVIAIVAVLATLLATAGAGARKRSQQTACVGNLRQIAMAAEIYHDDTGRRPRSLTHLVEGRHLLSPRSVLCSQDPAFAVATAKRGGNQMAWGNVANASQEPQRVENVRDIEAPTVQQEISEITERVPFSYLHPLGWRKSAWQKLVSRGSQVGIAICQLHGIRLASLDQRFMQEASERPYLAWEGLTLRAQRDGTVVRLKVFRGANAGPQDAVGVTPMDPAAGAVMVSPAPEDYPWEFYTDHAPDRR